MAITSIAPGTADPSDYSSRRVAIEVTGDYYSVMMRMGTSTMTVPYRCLSQTIQRIHRFGGKVTRVTRPKLHSEVSKLGSSQVEAAIAENNPSSFSKKDESISPPPKTQQPQNAINTRQATKTTTNGTQGQRSKRKPKG